MWLSGTRAGRHRHTDAVHRWAHKYSPAPHSAVGPSDGLVVAVVDARAPARVARRREVVVVAGVDVTEGLRGS